MYIRGLTLDEIESFAKYKGKGPINLIPYGFGLDVVSGSIVWFTLGSLMEMSIVFSPQFPTKRRSWCNSMTDSSEYWIMHNWLWIHIWGSLVLKIIWIMWRSSGMYCWCNLLRIKYIKCICGHCWSLEPPLNIFGWKGFRLRIV